MKKILSLVAMLAILATMLCACGKFTCDFCEEEKTGKKYKVEFMGEEGVMCEECHEEYEELTGK